MGIVDDGFIWNAENQFECELIVSFLLIHLVDLIENHQPNN